LSATPRKGAEDGSELDPLGILSKDDLAFVRSISDSKRIGARARYLKQLLRIRSSDEYKRYEKERRDIARHQKGGNRKRKRKK
jgi:hypothetical protein